MITRQQQQPPLESLKVITNIEYRGLMMNGENDKRLEPVKTMTMKELKLLRMLSSEDEYKDNLETNSMNTSLDAGLKQISLSSTSRSVSDGRYHIKQRCLILCSRGVTTRHCHFLEDLRTLILHYKKDSKLVVGKGAEGVG